MEAKHTNITDRIIKAFYVVYNTLGYGFLEKVYENAMAVELGKLGLKVVQQAPIKVYYHEHQVGYYNVDLLVQDTVIVELKATQTLAPAHEVELLLNFGPKPQIKRKVYDNERKGSLSWLRTQKNTDQRR